MDSQQLKFWMEKVWREKGCLCPNHSVKWFDYQTGYQCWLQTANGWITPLYFKKGKIMGSVRRKRI